MDLEGHNVFVKRRDLGTSTMASDLHETTDLLTRDRSVVLEGEIVRSQRFHQLGNLDACSHCHLHLLLIHVDHLVQLHHTDQAAWLCLRSFLFPMSCEDEKKKKKKRTTKTTAVWGEASANDDVREGVSLVELEESVELRLVLGIIDDRMVGLLCAGPVFEIGRALHVDVEAFISRRRRGSKQIL